MLGGSPPLWAALPGGTVNFYSRGQYRSDQNLVPTRNRFGGALPLCVALPGVAVASRIGRKDCPNPNPAHTVPEGHFRHEHFHPNSFCGGLQTGQQVRYCLEVHFSSQIYNYIGTTGNSTPPHRFCDIPPSSNVTRTTSVASDSGTRRNQNPTLRS